MYLFIYLMYLFIIESYRVCAKVYFPDALKAHNAEGLILFKGPCTTKQFQILTLNHSNIYVIHFLSVYDIMNNSD